MKYINAKALLPNELLQELQNYIQGSYLYVPVEDGEAKCWGEVSGYREALQQRNKNIIEAYKQGTAVVKLADQYALSIEAIRKIIYQK